ncbi:MAG: hypothetical protein ACPG4X_22135, partial [Pikeienuella sp.]
MLTDIFAIRYEETELFRSFKRREKRTIHQCFTILEDFHPYWGEPEKVRKGSAEFWAEIQKRLANELGVKALSQPWFETMVGAGEYRHKQTKRKADIEICRVWYSNEIGASENVDEYIKERLSLIEIGLRNKYLRAEYCRNYLQEGKPGASVLKPSYTNEINAYYEISTE